jgi:hypothetical protein
MRLGGVSGQTLFVLNGGRGVDRCNGGPGADTLVKCD